MSFFAICTFDLQNGSRQDYENAYSALAQLGFSKTVEGAQGQSVVLPTTMTAGEFTGPNAISIRDFLTERVSAAFQWRGFKSEIFVSVGGDWGWRHRLI